MPVAWDRVRTFVCSSVVIKESGHLANEEDE
jgi:hypothetical protein